MRIDSYPDRRIDLSGQRFGRLTVLYPILDGTEWTHIRYMCQCDCGNLTKATESNLKQGSVTSCGCYLHEIRKARKLNQYEFCDDRVVMKLNDFDVLIDYDDYEKFSKYTWHVRKDNQEIASDTTEDNGERRLYYLVNMILGFNGKPNRHLKINYLNGNKYDLRKCNLEILYPEGVDHEDYCELIESGIKYLTWSPRYLRWKVFIRKHETTKFYRTYQEAISFMKDNASLFI